MAKKSTVGGKKKKQSKQANVELAHALAVIDGFQVLPIQVPAATGDDDVAHYVYLKRHQAPTTLMEDENRVSEAKRTLFVLNLPVDATEADVRHWLRDAGAIEDVRFHTLEHWQEMYAMSGEEAESQGAKPMLAKKGKLKGRAATAAAAAAHKGTWSLGEIAATSLRPLLDAGSYAHVIFLEPLGLDRALGLTERARRWRDEPTMAKSKEQLPLGLARYQQAYALSRPNPDELEKRANAYILAHEERKREEEERIAATLNLPDEDGFITVRRVHRKRGNTDGKVTVKAIRPEQAQRLAPTGGKGKDVQDFYRFQQREAKREKLLELRRKFEEDKERIASMRANRRFRPY
ncbi:ribosomal RNA-processing protein 7-domain-containing protein [Thamnocephalis sphaerospora]|uniref:Ribosomal RNA-processing protein 7-domain-containing protein n=1 Tax=Thamnocephalis sphaerospora TaxID=78915 RepID=A0A4P9XMD5_9FUNG|nr:ribosomal RNA-processing protein 7-domain-containing protein [Thamnocephalis sphaerospora]|eukprot:RKP07016.1 ribosomal RNA-processing protein 7-domain-containing protein [Thamnocephalis sphaerospora]